MTNTRIPVLGLQILGLLIVTSCGSLTEDKEAAAKSHIRINLLGYLVSDPKVAIIGSDSNLEGAKCEIVPAENSEEVVFSGVLGPDRGSLETPFRHNMAFDFSEFTQRGLYRLKMPDGTVSHPFAIGALSEYRQALSSVLAFYRSQRCGDTQPFLHAPCHLNDAKAAIDASGGWHDAGDYIKYMITASFTAVELITAADYAISYGFGNAMPDLAPENGVPDLIEEARIGLEWILKMTSRASAGDYFYQVGGAEDHDHWRMPETDDETGVVGNPRTLHRGWGGNILGRSAAALAVASRVFKLYDPDFADECLKRAELLFADRKLYENAQPANPAEFYDEVDWLDDMVLGAAELFMTAGSEVYLGYARRHLRELKGDDIGWNGSDFLAFAASFRAGIEPEFTRQRMAEILTSRNTQAERQVFFLSSGYAWGTSALLTADAQKALMYYYLTEERTFLDLAVSQRDYLLGRNNWGTTFVIGLGPVYPMKAHSQLNDLVGLQPGGIVGGPARREHWRETMTNQWAFPEGKVENDRFAPFQGDVVYFDDQRDYYTNEVALDYAAPSVFIFLHTIRQALQNR